MIRVIRCVLQLEMLAGAAKLLAAKPAAIPKTAGSLSLPPFILPTLQSYPHTPQSFLCYLQVFFLLINFFLCRLLIPNIGGTC